MSMSSAEGTVGGGGGGGIDAVVVGSEVETSSEKNTDGYPFVERLRSKCKSYKIKLIFIYKRAFYNSEEGFF